VEVHEEWLEPIQRSYEEALSNIREAIDLYGEDLFRNRAGIGEHKAKNSVCFLFAIMLLCSSQFSTGARCVVFRAVF
jgi:hypothetical protein